jgi:FkbM family methyltransferase
MINDPLVRIISETVNSLTFNILEIGALPLGAKEGFHGLLEAFPGSRVIAFEVDPELCENLNKKAPKGLKYYPVALGRAEERRRFYQTVHPMCSSLYKPNEKLLGRYNNLEVAMLKSTGSLDTVSLDYFVRKNDIESVDFIKIDIQGAELEVFEGGVSTLKKTLAVVSEVEFVPLYEGQPLFGDVCGFLSAQGILFHKFLGLAGRTLKPVVLQNNPNFATQHLWSDAMYLRDIFQPVGLTSRQLLKYAIISNMYNSLDVALFCVLEYDKREKTHIAEKYFGVQQKNRKRPS